jgi:hypothetical protein
MAAIEKEKSLAGIFAGYIVNSKDSRYKVV